MNIFKNYELLSKDKVLLTFKVEGGLCKNIKLNTINIEFLPEGIKYAKNYLNQWISDRRLDVTRTNARVLLKNLNILGMNNINPVLINKALCLTDCYWIREEGNTKKWEEVNLYSKPHDQRIIDTCISGLRMKLERNPTAELTNIGSFDKAWKKVDNEWRLYKKGSPLNYYAELLTYKIGTLLDMNVAEYHVEDGLIYSKNFTDCDKVYLEHYASISLNVSDEPSIDPLDVYNSLVKAYQFLDKDIKEMFLLDALVSNTDRHEFNIGILRDVNTGKIVGMSPNYDNNLAFCVGNLSKPTTYLLKEYIKDFGIDSKLQSLLRDRLTKQTLLQLDAQTRIEANIPNTWETKIYINHVLECVEILNNLTKVSEW